MASCLLGCQGRYLSHSNLLFMICDRVDACSCNDRQVVNFLHSCIVFLHFIYKALFVLQVEMAQSLNYISCLIFLIHRSLNHMAPTCEHIASLNKRSNLSRRLTIFEKRLFIIYRFCSAYLTSKLSCKTICWSKVPVFFQTRVFWWSRVSSR